MRWKFTPPTTQIHFQNRVRHVACVGLLILTALGMSGCGGGNASRESSSNAKELAVAIYAYHEAEKAWPDKLEQVKPLIGKEGPVGVIGKGKDYATLLANPLTGDNPGYEYVKPQPDAPSSTTIVLYQLRGGKRDESLPVAFADSSVGPAKDAAH